MRLVRYLIEPYRSDRADAQRLEATFMALHGLLAGRRTLALELHLGCRASGAPIAWFAVGCPPGLERQVRAALRRAYPNLRLRAAPPDAQPALAAVRLQRRALPRADDELPEQPHGIEPLLRAMAAAGPPAMVRLLLAAASPLTELALSTPERRCGPLLWAAPVVAARDRASARAIASALTGGPPRLRAVAVGGHARRRPPRSPYCLFRAAELARLWALPAPEFSAVPCVRGAVPLAPAPPGIARTRSGGLLRDEHGALTIAESMRRQHVAVVGAVEQGKTSFLVASARDDLARPDCAVIVLDPKGDAAQAILSIVPPTRTVTLLDMAAPTAGFNPLAVDAAPDAIADHVVAALRGLFGDGEVRGSSDRYLRNALVAALACSREATLWDVARLLEVGVAGRAARAQVSERLIAMPAYAELATFFAEELPAQLADARATTTAKLDAPANKLARVLNSPAVKRVLLNESLRIDIDTVIERREVLVVRGALGEIGAGNVAVLMQLLLGMVDAALGRLQDRLVADRRGAVALKIDEAPLVVNEAFAQTLALKRSAGLETVACWQTDAQWEPELRERLDALFAHRVLFATASAPEARAASSLLMSEYSDQVRAGDEQLARLASPDLRLHLPRHTALASWVTAAGRERPFIATTLPLPVDRRLIDLHLAAQHARGARPLDEPAPPPSALEAPAPGIRAHPRAAAEPVPDTDAEAGFPALVAPAEVERSRGDVQVFPPAAERANSRPQRLQAPATAARPPDVQSPAPAAQSPARMRVAADESAATSTAPPSAMVHRAALEPQAPPASPGGLQPFAGSPAFPGTGPRPAATDATAPGYAELRALDGARSVRWIPTVAPRGAPTLLAGDRELLAWLVAARCALTTQIHRRINPDRALTATQRALKRLADQGLVARFQLYAADGGGVPQCCVATDAAIGLVGTPGRRAPALGDAALAALCADVRLVGWLLALEAHGGDAVREVLGPGRAALAPGAADPESLVLEPGLRHRDFVTGAPGGVRAPVTRFAPLRPDGAVEIEADGRPLDLLIALDGPRTWATLEAADHLLGGWWRTLRRYRRQGRPPRMIVVCAGEARALTVLAQADVLLSASLARIGVAATEWERPGREGVCVVSEAALHAGDPHGWAVPALPPELRPDAPASGRRVPIAPLRASVRAAAAKPPWR